MKAITLWEPWASLVAMGHKNIETRSWGSPYRGPLAIHAGKTREHIRLLSSIWADSELEGTPLPVGYAWPFGKIVAVVDMVACVKTEIITPSPANRAFGDFGPGRFAWVFDNIRMLEKPVHAVGAMGLRELAAAAEERVLEQLDNSEAEEEAPR